MTVRLTNTQVAGFLRQGPLGTGPQATPQQVIRLAEQRPEVFDNVMRKTYYAIAESSFKTPKRHLWSRYRDFIAPWADQIDRETLTSVKSAVEAYEMAHRAGMGELTAQSSADRAHRVVRALEGMETAPGSMTEMIVATLRGQAQSLWSREEAAATFDTVRASRFAEIIPQYSWDNGALSYYSREQIDSAALTGRFAQETVHWSEETRPGSKTAFFISVDPNFFRIYGPMMLFNAQQLHDIDLVLLICADEQEYDELMQEAAVYMLALAGLNGQPAASNVILGRIDRPSWVNDLHTFYACVRFLALPQVMQWYENVYMMDADLIMKDNPAAFLKKTRDLAIATPFNSGTVGVVPWRRYMAGSVLVSQRIQGTGVLESISDYIEHGLQQGFVWTLDQNALSFAAEAAPEGVFSTLEKIPRPVVASSFMDLWERNQRTRSEHS